MWHLGVSWVTSRVRDTHHHPSGEGWQTPDVKDFSPRDLVAGALLVVLVVAVTVFVDSDQAVFEDEAMVLAAISLVAPAEENCDISYGLNSDELNTGYQLMGGYGVTWGLPHADDTITTVVIECVVSEDVHGPNWGQWGVWFDLRLRYPLKSGSHAEVINDHIRRDVTAMISQYFINARDRVRHPGGRLTGLPDDSFHRNGELDITGFVSFMNDGLYSVGLHSDAHDPSSNTSENYLRTLNYDLTTGQQFFLPDLLYPGLDSYEALLRLTNEESGRKRDVSSWDINPLTIRQNLEKQHFTLTAEALALHCTWYCDQGIAPILLYKRNNGLGIPYERLADHLDPDGPYRHVAW